jgi:iron complex transport system ATP-binding protein
VITTHHLEELPASTTHALLLRDGHQVVAGPVAQPLAEEPLSECLGIRVAVARHEGRWAATAAMP